MRPGRLGYAALLLLFVTGEGCSAMREIPRGEYAAAAERKNVRLTTKEGLRYELDFAKVDGDTLLGYRRRDVEGPVEELATLKVPLDDVQTLSTRQLDWVRTGLIGGSVVAVLAVITLRKLTQDNSTDTSGGGPTGDKTGPQQ